MKRVFKAAALDTTGAGERDPEPIGLELWYGGENAKFDLVFIHGLMGNRNKTWQATDNDGSKLEPWPKALLPSEIPESRIFTLGYDARVSDTKEFLGKVSEKTLRDHAVDLILSVHSRRQVSGTINRPLIFVCHSLGGLLCKEALLFAQLRHNMQSITQSTLGVIFMGTPHQGSATASYARQLTSWVSGVKQINTKLLAALQKDSVLLQRIHDDFCALVVQRTNMPLERRMHIVCFFEELPMRAIGCVVSSASATIPGFTGRGIHANHKTMTKFSSKHDSGFQSFLEELSGILHQGIRKTLSCQSTDVCLSRKKVSVKGSYVIEFAPPQPTIATPANCSVSNTSTDLSRDTSPKLHNVSRFDTSETLDFFGIRYQVSSRNHVSTRRAFDCCLCFHAYVRHNSKRRLGLLKLFGETIQMVEHQPGCQFFNTARWSSESSRHHVEFVCGWIPWRLKISSVLINRSINLSMACVRIVGDDSPAFKLLQPFQMIADGRDDPRMDIQVVSRMTQKIGKLYREGRASLLDVHVSGTTLIYKILTCLASTRSFQEPDKVAECQKMVNKLRRIGWDPEINAADNYKTTEGVLSANTHLTAAKYFNVLENFVTGPLTAAISSRDYDQLREILQKRPRSAAEVVDSLGISCLSFTIQWPRGFSLMVDTFYSANLIEDQPDIVAETLRDAWGYLADNTRFHQNNNLHDEYSRDHEIIQGMLQPLLRLGIPCRCHRKLRALWTSYPVLRSQWAEDLFVYTLKSQREALKTLALQHLCPNDILQCGLSKESVLDAHAGIVTSKLLNLGVCVPEVLYVPLEYRSVYLDLMTLEAGNRIRDLFWENGFHDISNACICVRFEAPFNEEGRASSALWYLNHGVDFKLGSDTQSFRNPLAEEQSMSVLSSHLTASDLGIILEWATDSEIKEIVLEVSKWPILDACRCECAPSGCSALQVLFRKVPRRTWNQCNQLGHIFISHGAQIIRLMTFEELEIPHTCCGRHKESLTSSLGPDEIKEFREEYRHSLDQLDSLMATFEKKFEEENYNLLDFVNGYWVQKMDEVKKAQASVTLTKAELEAAQDVGVVWNSLGFHEDPITKKFEDYTTDDWLKFIDDI